MIGSSQGARLDAQIIGRADSGWFRSGGVGLAKGSSISGRWSALLRREKRLGEQAWVQHEWRTREPCGVRSPSGWASNDWIQ